MNVEELIFDIPQHSFILFIRITFLKKLCYLRIPRINNTISWKKSLILEQFRSFDESEKIRIFGTNPFWFESRKHYFEPMRCHPMTNEQEDSIQQHSCRFWSSQELTLWTNHQYIHCIEHMLAQILCMDLDTLCNILFSLHLNRVHFHKNPQFFKMESGQVRAENAESQKKDGKNAQFAD